MTRNRERRSFTVAAKSSGHQGFVSIPAKAPRMPKEAPRKPVTLDPWAMATEVGPAAPDVRAEAEPRRILPSLIAWAAPEPDAVPEPALPRVRRAVPQAGAEDAPRRRGRPRKTPLPTEPTAPAPRAPESVPAAPPEELLPARAAPVALARKNRPQSETLRLGERWKRRLPRSCW